MTRIRRCVPPASAAPRRVLAAILLGLAAASCAREPQVVFISPELAGPPDRISQQPRVELAVKDGRATPVIGSRGGTIDRLATITTDGDITPALSEELAAKLVEQGFVVVRPGDGSDVRLVVTLEELTYETGGSVLTEIKVSSTVGVTCTKGGDTLSSRYRTNHREEFATAPSKSKNSELVNMVVAKSLEQMLADDELRTFMAN